MSGEVRVIEPRFDVCTDVKGIRITALPGIHILGQKRGAHVMTEQERISAGPMRSNLPAGPYSTPER